jgi:hypothetical protein
MSAEIHPAAIHHLPIFITPPDQTDVLMVVTAAFLLIVVVTFGLLFLRLHSLPERMAHRGHKLQFEIVAVLCLVALFTHIHGFWIAALLLALIDLPDISGWMGRIAGGVERIASVRSAENPTKSSPEEASTKPRLAEKRTEVEPGNSAGYALSDGRPGRSLKDKEFTHA